MSTSPSDEVARIMADARQARRPPFPRWLPAGRVNRELMTLPAADRDEILEKAQLTGRIRFLRQGPLVCGLALVVTYLLASHLGSFVWTLGPVIAVVLIQALRQHHVHQAIREELSAYRTLKLTDALRPTETGADTELSPSGKA